MAKITESTDSELLQKYLYYNKRRTVRDVIIGRIMSDLNTDQGMMLVLLSNFLIQ